VSDRKQEQETIMTVDIKNIAGWTLYHSDSATSVKEAVQEAVAANVSLSGADLSGAQLRGLHVKGGDFEGASFAGADVAYSTFDSCRLCDTYCSGMNASYAQFPHCNMMSAVMTRSGFTYADLSGASCSQTAFDGSDLTSATARNAYFNGTSFIRADISLTDFHGSQMKRANLFQCTAARTDFSSTDLTKASFYGTYLSNADVTNANMDGANLERAQTDGMRGWGTTVHHSRIADLPDAGMVDEDILVSDHLRTNPDGSVSHIPTHTRKRSQP
jgi:uncharacterized protein YjbI with pentapeptide repeats